MRNRRAKVVRVFWNHPETDERYEVECSVTPYDPGRTYGPPEDCYPPEGGEVELLGMKDEDGRPVSAEVEKALVENDKEWARVEDAATEEACDYDDPPDRDDWEDR